ncbi:MAG: 2-isopropylmalate synthase, partial [Clostridia bacterium]|nr:2-isopropylmalate synthase [Clostridia bacterium]
IDPADIGRKYEPILINSQSGKGGVSFIMENKYGYKMPKKMLVEFAAIINDMSDEKQTVLTNHEIHVAFKDLYVNSVEPLKLKFYHSSEDGERTHLTATIEMNGKVSSIEGRGNGPLDAICKALRGYLGTGFEIASYDEHALERASSSRAAAYISIHKENDDKMYWGAGVDGNINTASIYALISAVNRMLADK